MISPSSNFYLVYDGFLSIEWMTESRSPSALWSSKYNKHFRIFLSSFSAAMVCVYIFRQVTKTEGSNLAHFYNAAFFETSAAEEFSSVERVFHEAIRGTVGITFFSFLAGRCHTRTFFLPSPINLQRCSENRSATCPSEVYTSPMMKVKTIYSLSTVTFMHDYKKILFAIYGKMHKSVLSWFTECVSLADTMFS